MKMNKQNKQLNRRDVLKLAALAGMGTLAGTTEAEANEMQSSKKDISKKHPLHIAIIGGGMAGTALAYRLSRAITYPRITLYEPEEKSCWYQPGLTMVGTGLWPLTELAYERENYIPMHVSLNRNPVTSVDAQKRTVTDSSGKSITYDYIVVASGLQLDFSAIEGLSREITSFQHLDKTESWMNDPVIGSVYYMHGAFRLSNQLTHIVEKAQNGKKVKIFFTQPKISFKSPAAAKSVLMDLVERLKKAGIRDRAEIVFVSEDGRLSANDTYDKAYRKLLSKEQVSLKKDKLINIDTAKQKAVFSETGEIAYDFIHITPPMKAGNFLAESDLLNDNGFVDVDAKTLEHKKYPQIFAIGDISGCSVLKSASAISSQVKIITDTIRRLDEGKKPKAKYDGYGRDTLLCPESRSALYETWNYQGNPLSPVIDLSPTKCHVLYWYSTLYLSKTYMMNGVLRGWA